MYGCPSVPTGGLVPGYPWKLKSYSWPSVSEVLHPQIQSTLDPAILQYLLKKIYVLSGSGQFKPMLFKGLSNYNWSIYKYVETIDAKLS